MSETRITRRDFHLLFERQTTAVHKIVVTRFQGHRLEMEDFHFHLDSAVLLPDYDIGEGAADRITALTVLAAGLAHAKTNPARKALVAGHADSSGASDYNLKLSQQRADCVLACWTGDKVAYTNLCAVRSKTEDYQQILQWVHQSKGWNCHPGPTDNIHGNGTSTALKNFKTAYNAEFSQSLPVTGACDKVTWEAFFDLYNQGIAQFLATSIEGLAAYRASLRFVDPGRRTVGCGESWPVEGMGVDGLQSAANRRVEILFFDPGQEPLLECHPAPNQCKATECELYWTKCFKHTPIPVKAGPVPAPGEALDIVSCDDHFAPSAETLSIAYKLKGLEGKPVTLEITSPRADATPLFTRELTGDEKTSGDHTFAWDGKPTAGALKDLYIHPLWSPYKVTLRSGSLKDEAEFKVLYHSLAISRGPWTHDGQEPPTADQRNWVAYRLNELGFYGGPVYQDTEEYLDKAIIRYKANHKAMHRKYSKDYKADITPELIAALEAGDNKRVDIEPDAVTDPAATSRIWVEALTYERTTGNGNEFRNQTNRATTDAARLNRPLLPLEVEIFLKSKTDARTAAPEAIGPVRINWKHTDLDEDLTLLPEDKASSPSKTRKYVAKALKLRGGGPGADNCPRSLGGIRNPDMTHYQAPWFQGGIYEPYQVEDDATHKTVFAKACTNKAKYPKRLGRSGILARTSIIGCDDYQFRAEIDFTGEPNQAELEKFHGYTDADSRIHVRTGIFRIWRRNRVAYEVNWPARSGGGEWDLIHNEYKAAYVDLDVGSMKKAKISELITEKQYQDIVIARTANKDRTKISLKENAVYGLPLPAQGAKESARDYRARLKTLTGDNYWSLIADSIVDALAGAVRPQEPVGFVVMNFLAHEAVDVKKVDGTIAEAGHISWTTSFGMADSHAMIDMKDPDKVYYVVGHEMGHNFYLRHSENTGDKPPGHHDTSDHNCIMAYSSTSSGHAHQAPGVFEPHLCGKCNLKLRGWDMDKLPGNSD
ncbi:MAG: hypothetical protein ACK6DY_20845 [Acidobacteriota bacterium]